MVPKSQIKIAIVAGGPNVYFTTWGQVAQVMSKQLGVTVTYVVPPTPTYDPSVEVSTIDSLVAQGYNAFAIFPDGESAIIPTYQRLVSRGIPVFDLAGCTTDPTPALLCYATNVKASATYETQVLQKAMGGSGNIAFLTGLLTDANTALREQGVNQAVAASGGQGQAGPARVEHRQPELRPARRREPARLEGQQPERHAVDRLLPLGGGGEHSDQ